MKRNWVYTIVRVLVGLLFTTTGVLKFYPVPDQHLPGAAGMFMKGLVASGYLIPVLGLSEFIIGLILLFNAWPALAAVMLVPVTLNIFLFDTILAPSAWMLGTFCLLANAYLLYSHKEQYMPMLKK